MKSVLVKFEYDSFDLGNTSYKIFSEDSWETFCEQLEDYDDEIEIYCRTNIAFTIKSGKKFISMCDVQYKVTDNELKILQKLNLNLDQLEVFKTVEDILSDE